MVEIIWAEEALNDIDDIAAFIAKDSPERAAIFVSRLTEATDRLIEFPASGREIPEIGKDNYREIIYGSYRIMYKTEDLKIYILAVAHAARNWQFDFE